ncbi:MAG: DUF3108 domain-containing protein [Candidatus Omnitrophica bacterium]|nr:DUF3108 domain-containing protein [Candidatus Omnitrophota bacterium]
MKRLLRSFLISLFAVGAALCLGFGIYQLTQLARLPEQFVKPLETLAPFAEGEQMRFKIYWKRVRIGSAVMTFYPNVDFEGQRLHKIVVALDTATFDDREEIYLSPDNFLPVKIFRDIRQMGARKKIVEDYDQLNKRVTVTQEGADREPTVIERAGPLHNVICLIYLVRQTESFAPDWNLNVFLPTVDFDLKFSGSENVEVPAGDFEALAFTGNPNEFRLWASDDARRLPLKFRSAGLLKYEAVLTDFGLATDGEAKESDG